MNKIGFIGLGHMGAPMAMNLLKAGHEVFVYDVKADAVATLVKAGAKKVSEIAELAQKADVVITSVQTGDQVREICMSPDGLFSNANQNLLYIDCSSVDIVTTLELHAEAEQLQIEMVDAPVSGGVVAAQSGKLTFMIGGNEHAFKLAEKTLQPLAKKIVHAGPAGHGAAAKICNNLLLGISMIGVCEAFTLAKRLGLDPKKFYEISSNASGQCWSMTSYCPVPDILTDAPSSHDYEPGFMAKMMLKDLRLGQHAAESVDAAIPLGAVATELYELYVSQGHGDKDFSGIINLLETDLGAE